MKKILRISLFVALPLLAIAHVTGLIDLMQVWDFLTSNPEGLLFGAVAAGAAPGDIIAGTATLDKAKTEAEEDYTELDLEKKIILVGQQDFVVDTLTRELGNKRITESIETGGWEIGQRDVVDQVDGDVSAQSSSKVTEAKVDKPAIWTGGETMIIQSGDNEYHFYVESVNLATSKLSIRLIGEASEVYAPALADDAKILRLGAAKSELDAQTDPTYLTPVSRTNYCQVHMAQVEESVIHSLHKKKVALDFNTMKERTLWDMKYKMEMTNLFGKKDYFVNTNGKRIYTSDGIWEQVEKEYIVNSNSAMNTSDWVAMCKYIFEGNNGSPRRVAIIGPDLMVAWSNVDAFTKQMLATNTEVVFGVRFNRIETNFGELLVKSGAGILTGMHSNKGIIFDPAFIRKDVYEALNMTPLDLDATGQRRVKAVRILENYCLYVENQPVHCKLTYEPVAATGGAATGGEATGGEATGGEVTP